MGILHMSSMVILSLLKTLNNFPLCLIGAEDFDSKTGFICSGETLVVLKDSAKSSDLDCFSSNRSKRSMDARPRLDFRS